VPKLTDAHRLAAYLDALGNWKITGYVQFELTEEAHRWIRRELNSISLKELARLMYEHVRLGGEIDEIAETHPEWSGQYEFHHDLRLTVQNKVVYVETRLHYRLPIVPDESSILVVNVHER